MNVPSATRLMAGSVLLLSLLLAQLVSPYFFILTGFVGLNLAQSAFTGTCPAVFVFKKMGLKSECEAGFSVSRFVNLGSGMAIIAVVGLGHLLNSPPLVYAVAGVIGLSMLQSSFTGWCPLMSLARLSGARDAELC